MNELNKEFELDKGFVKALTLVLLWNIAWEKKDTTAIRTFVLEMEYNDVIPKRKRNF